MERLSELEKKRLENLRNHVSERDDIILQAYTEYVRQSREKAAERLHLIDLEIACEKMLLQEERENSRADSVNGERRSTSASRAHAEAIEGLLRQKQALTAISPDAFCMAHAEQILQDVSDEREGRLVNVPYLRRAKKRIADSLDAGIPVYLVGHLGSGKTQLAVECAQDYMRRRMLQKVLEEKMKAFRADGDDNARRAYFASIYPEAVRQAEKADCHPYFISGSHNLTAEDMFSEKTLKLSHAGAGGSYEKQLASLIEDFVNFCHENEARLQSLDKGQQLEMMLAGWKTFSEIYIQENSGFGTTVEKVEKEVLLALREGRPVIIDEINTIAMPNLIALNDILQHHAGQSAYITGIGTVQIADGFCLIGTGNLSTGTVSYEGTNVLNPAFQSRFTTIEYNYVPQSTEGNLSAAGGKNELFRLIIEHLCDSEGELSIPSASTTVDELWRLAQLARMSQNIFEGRATDLNPDGDAPVLNEAVLSIRNLVHVLDLWNFGEEMDLSMALWEGFLGSVTNGDDRNLLLSLSVRYGFFREQDGWHVQSKARGEGGQTYEDIRQMPYIHEIRPLEHLSREDVVHLLFGPGPKRTSLPDSLKKDIAVDEDTESSAIAFMQLDEEVRHLERSAAALGTMTEEPGDFTLCAGASESGK